MTTDVAGQIPEVTLGWRLRMSLGDIKAQEMADWLDVSRQTLTRWMHDVGAPPKQPFLRLWAVRTGVPLKWLETGEIPDAGPGGDDGESVGILLGRQRLWPLSYVRDARELSRAA